MRPAAQDSATLLETYYTDVLGVAYQIVGDATLAARAATTIFGRLARRRLSPDEAPIMLWRTALKILRGYHAHGLTVTPMVPGSADWQATLLNQLGRLAPDDRILLLLRYREGLDDDALAAVLQVDRQTARTRLAHARSRLLAEQSRHALR